MRPDHWAAKNVYQHQGLSKLRTYHTLPYFDCRGVFEHNAFIEIDYDMAFPHVPYPNFIMQLADQTVVNVVTQKQETLAKVAKAFKMPVEGGSRYTLVQSFSRVREDVVIYQLMCVVYPDGRFSLTGIDTTPGPNRYAMPDKDFFADFVKTVAGMTEKISKGNDHPVEVRPSSPLTPREKKTAEKMPWLRGDLPRIILIDPSKATQYGHRVDRGGTHASPVPHPRRGHFATLRAERYKNKRGQRVWVKPAWIGDSEWVFNGSRYKVLDIEKRLEATDGNADSAA